jgi:hypothetical protein
MGAQAEKYLPEGGQEGINADIYSEIGADPPPKTLRQWEL